MKKLTLLNFGFLAILTLSVMVFYTSSCKKDPCKDVSCLNGGSCDDGTCLCPSGYEGTECGTESRTKFLNAGNTDATYGAIENGSSSGGSTYDLTLKQSGSDVAKILIGNVWDNFTNNVVATVSGNTITFARQSPDSDGYFVVGSGTISGSTISVNYTVTNETGGIIVSTDNITGTWTKK